MKVFKFSVIVIGVLVAFACKFRVVESQVKAEQAEKKSRMLGCYWVEGESWLRLSHRSDLGILEFIAKYSDCVALSARVDKRDKVFFWAPKDSIGPGVLIHQGSIVGAATLD